MFGIPNQMPRRVGNYFTEAGGPTDGRWWYRRFRPVRNPGVQTCITLPTDPVIPTKQSDPNWRHNNDSWVLLESDFAFGYDVYFAASIDSKIWMKSLIFLPEQLFAMRIGPNPVHVAVATACGMSEVSGLRFYDPQGTNPFVRSGSEMIDFLRKINRKAFFI